MLSINFSILRAFERRFILFWKCNFTLELHRSLPEAVDSRYSKLIVREGRTWCSWCRQSCLLTSEYLDQHVMPRNCCVRVTSYSSNSVSVRNVEFPRRNSLSHQVQIAFFGRYAPRCPSLLTWLLPSRPSWPASILLIWQRWTTTIRSLSGNQGSWTDAIT